MKIKNLTNTIQRLWVKNPRREGSTSYSIEVSPDSSRDILDSYPDFNKMPDFDKYFAIDRGDNLTISSPKKEEPIASIQNEDVVEITVEEDTQTSEVVESQESTIIEDKFICEICGAEFASARGLTSHMNRSHSE